MKCKYLYEFFATTSTIAMSLIHNINKHPQDAKTTLTGPSCSVTYDSANKIKGNIKCPQTDDIKLNDDIAKEKCEHYK